VKSIIQILTVSERERAYEKRIIIGGEVAAGRGMIEEENGTLFFICENLKEKDQIQAGKPFNAGKKGRQLHKRAVTK